MRGTKELESVRDAVLRFVRVRVPAVARLRGHEPVEEPVAPAKPKAIDPRFRARRIAVRRDEGRRRLRRLTVLGSVCGAVVLAFGVTRSPFLDVDRVQVVGATHTPVELVQSASGVQRHQAMTDVQLARAEEGVLALPWVSAVEVTRHWPGTIRINVTERSAIAAVPDVSGLLVLVDRDGRLLERVVAAPPGVVVFADIASGAELGTELDGTADAMLTVASQLPTALVATVESVAPAEGGGVDLHLGEGGRVHLGPPDDLADKLTAVLTVLEQVDLMDLCSIDVRVPSAPSLTRGNRCA